MKSFVYGCYALAFCAGALGLLTTIFAVNASVDPQADFVYLTGGKPHQLLRIDNSVDAKFKTAITKSLRPGSIDAAVFGSSRAFRINPRCNGLREFGPKTFNLSVQASGLPSVAEMIKLARQNSPKMVSIVALDFFFFSKNDGTPMLYLDPHRKWEAKFDAVLRLLDLRTLQESLTPADPSPRHVLMPDGWNIMNRKTEEVARTPIYLEEFAKKEVQDVDTYDNFEYDPKKFEILRKLKEEGPVVFFLNPESRWYLEPLRRSDLWLVYERWKRELSEFGGVVDFSDCAEITADTDMYFDEHHYVERAGDLIMEDVANAYFGRQLKRGKVLGYAR
jgi:hypothetical protein